MIDRPGLFPAPGETVAFPLPVTGVLAINAGSSSIKFGLFTVGGTEGPVCVARGALEDAGPEHRLTMVDTAGAPLCDQSVPAGSDEAALFEALLEAVDRQLGETVLTSIGHRVVHGGRDFDRPVVIDDDVLARIDRLTPLAPLHQPRSLQPLRILQALRPGLAHVACFDTAFHHDLKPPVSRYAIPRRFDAEGVRKYGFHGLSYEFVAGRLAQEFPERGAGRTIVAHLGNGASLCAMQDGKSVDTTMGFSALDGLVMGTRCGALDPGIVLYLQKTHGLSVEAVEDILYRQSGLIGVSGLASDMRVLLASKDAGAKEAIDLFTFAVAREAAAMANSLAGLDCLVFTGGIGAHAPRVRADVCARLGWLGVECDPARNEGGAARIDAPVSRVKILVLDTDEELVIARHAALLWSERSLPASRGTPNVAAIATEQRT